MRYLFLIIGFTVVMFSGIFYAQYSFFVIPPFDDKSNGASLIMERENENFFESADSLCMKNQKTSSHFCRISTFNEILETKDILLAFSYSDFLNNMALFFLDPKVTNTNLTGKKVSEKAMDLLSEAQELKAAVLMARMEGEVIHSVSDLSSIPEKKRLLGEMPNFEGANFRYELETITLRDNVNSEICFALSDLGGAIIYDKSKLYEKKYGCYMNNFKPLFFYN